MVAAHCPHSTSPFRQTSFVRHVAPVARGWAAIVSLCGLALMLLAAPAVAEEVPADLRFGKVQYPALGNLQLDEGTVEVYIQAHFNTDQPNSFSTSIGPFFIITIARSTENAVLFYVTKARKIAMVGYFAPVNHSYVNSSPKGKPGLTWKDGEHHVVAFTWKGDRRQVIIDGVPGEETKVEGPLPIDLNQATLQVGGGASLFAVDELRISSVVRSLEELKAAVNVAPQADMFTLLLDHFDEAPAVLGGNPATAKRVTDGPALVVEGKFGKALRLWQGTRPSGM